jgi:hypothetical protein
MYPFVVDSRFGKFDAYGRAALALRVREIEALHELARTSDTQGHRTPFPRLLGAGAGGRCRRWRDGEVHRQRGIRPQRRQEG